MGGVVASFAHLTYPFFAYQPLTPYWLTLSVVFDIFIGLIPFFFLIVLWPWLNRRAVQTIKVQPGSLVNDFEAASMSDYATVYSNKIAKTFKLKRKTNYERPAHLHTWLSWMWIKLVAWSLLVGVFGDLLLSEGWRAPLSVSAFAYDFLYARANDQPNGAHIVSYIGVPIFGLVVAYKYRPAGMERFLGDIIQGISAAGFLGAVHELIWITFYYVAYAQFLSWTILPELVRDMSFVIMMVLLAVTYWKFQGRKTPMSAYKWPVIVYGIFCLAWFVIPRFFGYYWFPITTINNPQFGTGLYQETPWFGDPWVNLVEVFSWIMLYASFIFVVVRHKNK